MKNLLHFQPGARRLAVALALCAALLLCLSQAALAQTVMLEGFTFTLPDTLEHQDNREIDGFLYRTEDDTHKVAVGIGHCFGGEEYFGLTQDWIYEQLEKGDGEYMQNLIHGQPTLFLQAVNEELGVSYALAATTMNERYIIGFERQTGTTEPIGDVLLEVISSAESYTPQIRKGVSSITPESTPEPTPEPTVTPMPTAKLALGQKVTIEGFTFALPDTFVQAEKDDNGFAYHTEADDHVLGVGIGHCYDIEDELGVSLDWIYEQLDKGDGEHMQNLIHGQPTLFLQAADEFGSYALAAIKLNGSYIIGGEGQADTQSTGDLLLEVLSSVEFDAPQVTEDVASVTEKPTAEPTAEPTPEPTAEPTPEPTAEPTPEPTAEPTSTPQPAASNGSLLPLYHPDDCQAWSYNETYLLYLDYPGGRKATDDFLFCGLDWDTDLDTVLRTIAANTNREMADAGNGSYMGVDYSGSPFWGLNSNECYLTLISVIPEENGWWVECQLTPEQIQFADEQEAAAWFTRVWQSLDWEEHGPSTYTFELEGQGRAVGSAEELISLWQDAAAGGAESVYAFVTFNNLTLSLEKDLYGDESYISCWLALVPGER